MAGSGTKPKGYKVNRRRKKRVRPQAGRGGRAVVFVCNEVLREVWIHADEQKGTGLITFVTRSGKEIRRTLVYTWFPQGIWKVKYSGRAGGEHTAEVISAENVEPIILNRLVQMSQGRKIHLYRCLIKGTLPYDQMIDCLLATALDREITVRVTYSLFGGNGSKLPRMPLSDDYLEALRNEMIARIFLIMLEHFAGINIDETIAKGGISRAEYRKLIKLKSNTPGLGPKTIARVTTQGTYEYLKINETDVDSLTLMIEAILYQRKRLNPLATNNQLQIARGLMRPPQGGKLIEDVGIKRRGESCLLLYDRFGNAIPAFVGFMDQYYRNLDLDKVAGIKINLGDSGFAQFLRVMEQTFAFPTRETYHFLAGVCDFYAFIVPEIGRLYGGEIQKKVMEMLPTAIGFFVVHAVVGAMARRGNPIAAAILVAAKAIGWIMNVDMGLATAGKMANAGRHFAMMEQIHRRSPKEKGKVKLTTLSKYHLEVGTRWLIDAMSDLMAQGVFIAGGKLGAKAAGKFAKIAKVVKNRIQAKIEITIKNGVIVKVRCVKGSNTIEIQTQAPALPRPVGAGKMKGATSSSASGKSSMGGGGKRGTTSRSASGKSSWDAKGGSKGKGSPSKDAGGKGKGGGKKPDAHDSPPLEESGQNLGRRQRPQRPTKNRPVKIDEYQYKTTDPRNRPASSEAVSGLPEQHLRQAVQVAGEQQVMAIFRTTNSRGVQHILNGHPPKGKDLIAINTSKTTGKVTCRTTKQFRIALKNDYYVLRKNGYAYNKAGQRMTGADGKPVKFDMKQRGAHGELTNSSGQVIDPKTRKAVVGDYDLQDVIKPTAQGRNLAAVPETSTGDVVSPDVKKFADAFNSRLRQSGDVNRIVHGADAQFIQYRHFRNGAFKGEAIGILPDGRVVHFTPKGLAKFYKDIGRSRLDLGSKRVRLEEYRK